MCTDSRLTRTVGIVGVCVVAGAVVVAARGDESRGEGDDGAAVRRDRGP